MNSNNLQKLFINFISFIELVDAKRRFSLNIIIATHSALEIATFNLFLLKKKSLCLGKLSTSDEVMDIRTTLASCPWNKSICLWKTRGPLCSGVVALLSKIYSRVKRMSFNFELDWESFFISLLISKSSCLFLIYK